MVSKGRTRLAGILRGPAESIELMVAEDDPRGAVIHQRLDRLEHPELVTATVDQVPHEHRLATVRRGPHALDDPVAELREQGVEQVRAPVDVPDDVEPRLAVDDAAHGASLSLSLSCSHAHVTGRSQ